LKKGGKKMEETGEKKQYVTIKDIAEYVGVSTATVSLALSRNPRIPDETREKIIDAAKKLGYRPSTLARGLVKNKTYTIALVIPQIKRIFVQAYFALSVSGVYDELTEHGYKLLLEMASYEFVRRKRYLRLFRERSIDGMIYIGSTLYDTYLKEILEEGYPFVFVGSYLPDIKIPYVTGDNFKGGYIATKHLISCGYKRIGLITGSLNVVSAVDRFKGYKKALKENGFGFNPKFVEKGHFSEEGGYEAMKKLIKKKVDAVFAGNDLMAQGAYRAIKESGLRIPQDIGVVGMDDLPSASLLDPPLTTVKYPIYEMGRVGVKKLIEMSEKGIISYFEEVLPVKLIFRKSTSKVR